MIRPATNVDLLLGYLAQIVNIGAGLITLPFILRYLSPEDVGLWLVFSALAGLAQLLEFGFQPTLIRNISYVYAGSQTLTAHGIPSLAPFKELNISLLLDLIDAGRTIYQSIALFASALLLIGGTIYIYTLLTPLQSASSAFFAWILFASGQIATAYFGYYGAILQGRGDITQANKVTLITRGMFVILVVGLVESGLALIGVGLASLVASILGRWVAMRYVYSAEHLQHAIVKKWKGNGRNLIKTLWHNASRQGVVNIGAFLIQRGNLFIASSFLGLAATASYGITSMILTVLGTLSTVIFQVQIPHMNAMQAKGDLKSLKAAYGEVILVSWLTFIIGFALLGLIGNTLLDAIGSKTHLLPIQLLLTYSAITLLEINHTIAATYLTTMNRIPFVRAALWSGLAILLLSAVLVSHLGILSLIMAQGLVQLVYNNWRWPYEAHAQLKTNTIELLALGAKRLASR